LGSVSPRLLLFFLSCWWSTLFRWIMVNKCLIFTYFHGWLVNKRPSHHRRGCRRWSARMPPQGKTTAGNRRRSTARGSWPPRATLRKERINSVGASCHVEFCRWPALSAPRRINQPFYDSTRGGSSALMEASVEMGACHSPPQPQCHTTTTSVATHSHHARATCVQGVPSSPGVLLLSVPSGLQRWWLALTQQGSTESGEDQGRCYTFFFFWFGVLCNICWSQLYSLYPPWKLKGWTNVVILDWCISIFFPMELHLSCKVPLLFSPLIPSSICCQTFLPLLLMINIKAR
jgi:hypothetical protein